jgi:hypothetical protein
MNKLSLSLSSKKIIIAGILLCFLLQSCDENSSKDHSSSSDPINSAGKSQPFNPEHDEKIHRCIHDVEGAASTIIESTNQIYAEIEATSHDLGASASIPTIVNLEIAISKAQLIVADPMCKKEVLQAGLELRLSQAQKVHQHAEMALENRMAIVRKLSEDAARIAKELSQSNN